MCYTPKMPIQIGDGQTQSFVINLLDYTDRGGIAFSGIQGDVT